VTWTWNGYTVEARTKSEARARIKALLQKDQDCTFKPERIRRLPVGAIVKKQLRTGAQLKEGS